MAKKQMIRKSPDVMDKFVDRLMQGRYAKNICKEDADMPHWTTLWRWIKDDPEFRDKYRFAMEMKAQDSDHRISLIQEDVRDVVQKVRNEEMTKDAALVSIHAARLDIDTEKWRAAKLYPRMYGNDTQRVEVEHKGGSFLDDLKVVAARVEARKAIQVIDAEVESEGVGGQNLPTVNATFSREDENDNENHSQVDVADETE